MKSGNIFDIKRYAINDGPGIRITVFFKGCPLRCWWCHNPEGLSLKPELTFIRSKCLEYCDECVKNCPNNAISYTDKIISIDQGKCDLCGDCSLLCPAEALKILGKRVRVEEVMKEIEKDMVFYDESMGGVTFSGGEPLMQPEFLNALLEDCKKRGFHTTLDTSGYSSPEVIDKIKDKVDLFLYDIKMVDDKKHKEVTGVSNKLILDNVRKLSKNGNKIVIRIPVIPEINDTNEDIVKIAEFISSLQGVKDISLLPYHRIGAYKYERLNKSYLMQNTLPFSEEKTEKIKKRLECFGFKVKIGD